MTSVGVKPHLLAHLKPSPTKLCIISALALCLALFLVTCAQKTFFRAFQVTSHSMEGTDLYHWNIRLIWVMLVQRFSERLQSSHWRTDEEKQHAWHKSGWGEVMCHPANLCFSAAWFIPLSKCKSSSQYKLKYWGWTLVLLCPATGLVMISMKLFW